MASTKVRGITIELGADTSGISKALKDVNSEIGSTQRQLKDVERLLKLDPSNTELLRQKQELLKDSINETIQKLDKLEAAQKEVGKTYKETGEGKEQYDALTREIISCREELSKLVDEASSFNKAMEKIDAAGTKLQEVGGKISSVGDSMTRNVTMPIVGVGAAITKVAGDFEEQMAKVSAISQAYGDDLQSLKDYAIELGENGKFSATEIAQAYEYMGMAGWKTNQILAGTKPIIDLATASGEDLASVSDIVTDGLTAFGLKAEDTGRFVNVLAEAARSSNTNVGMMGESFKYVAPVAGSLGYSVEDVGIALGTMANSGIKASMAGTTLRNIFQRMTKPTKESEMAMDRLGLSMYDANGRMYSLREILLQLRKGFSEINMPLDEYNKQLDELDRQLEEGEIKESKYNSALEELNKQAFGAEGAEKARAAAMLGGARAMAGLTAIAQATESDFNNLSEAIDGSSGTMVRTADGSVMHLTQALNEGKDVIAEYDGTAASMAGTMNDTANVHMKEFTNQLQSIAIQLGDTLLPILKEVVTQLSEWTAKFKELTPEEQEVIVKTALVVAALGPLLSVGGRLISGIGTLLKLGPQVVKMMGTTAGSIALPIAAAAAFVAIIAVYGDQIQAILAEVDAYLQNVFATDWTKTFGTLGEPINYVLAQVRNFWNSFRTIFNGLIDFIRGVFTGDWDRAWKGVKEIFEGYFKMYAAIVKTPLNAVIGMINTVIGAFDQLGEKLNGYTFERPEWLGGGSWSFHVPTFNKIPYLAKGGILSEGSAIVGEAGPELLTMSDGRAVVQPLTNNTNNYAGATNNFYIQNNDPYAVAEQVSEILDHQTQQMAHAWS